MYWNFNIEFRLVILSLRGWSAQIIGQGNPMIFNMLKFHFNVYCKNNSVWNILLILLQNGTSASPGSLYIDFIGHVILDKRIFRIFK